MQPLELSGTAMRTCLVIVRFELGQPGFLDFSYRIQALGKHYQLIIVSNFPLDPPELQVQNARYIVIPEGKGRVGWLRYLWDCARLAQAERPDRLVLLHSAVAPIALLTGGIPTVLYWNEHPTHMSPVPNGVNPVRHLTRSAIRRIMYAGARRATLVMPIGEAHADDLLAHGCNPQRVRLLYMGVDALFQGVAARTVWDESDRPLELVYIGSVSQARGRDVMLEALALVNRSGRIARLTVVGASPDQIEFCQTYAQRLGIRDDVHVEGRIPGHAIPEVLRHSDAGICIWEDRPWWRFNPPTKLFEYLVAGLPVLGSNIRTHTQYVCDWENGLIFDYDSASLATAIEALWKRRDELPHLKQRALKSGATYLWDKIEAAFLDAVETMQ